MGIVHVAHDSGAMFTAKSYDALECHRMQRAPLCLLLL